MSEATADFYRRNPHPCPTCGPTETLEYLKADDDRDELGRGQTFPEALSCGECAGSFPLDDERVKAAFDDARRLARSTANQIAEALGYSAEHRANSILAAALMGRVK